MDASLTPTLACALKVEERVARAAGARTMLVGLGAEVPAPAGELVSFGFAGSLVDSLAPGELLTATKVVDPDGATLWEGDALGIPGARPTVICSVSEVVDDPQARRALAARSGAEAVDMESGNLAATGRLAGVLRAVTDTPAQPVGALGAAGKPDGSTDWKVVAKAFSTAPVRSVRSARNARLAMRALSRGAKEFS
ncbi:MAG: hypothetical protein ABI649_00145 [Gaiellaceae bacterium]